MRKIIVTAVASLLLALGLGPAAFADYGAPDPANHLSPTELPRCYDTGLTIGVDDVCTSYVTCDQGDGTCNSFCAEAAVECTYVDEPGARTWSNILYGVIDRYRSQGTDLATRVAQQAQRIARLKAHNRHLRHKIHRLKTRLRHSR